MTCFSCLLVKSFFINFCYYLRISKLVILFTINTFLPFVSVFIILRSRQVCLEGVVVEDNIIQTSNNIPHYTLHITHYTLQGLLLKCSLWSVVYMDLAVSARERKAAGCSSTSVSHTRDFSTSSCPIRTRRNCNIFYTSKGCLMFKRNKTMYNLKCDHIFI